MMAHFIRFTNDAPADVARGHSFAGYASYPTYEAALESDEVEYHGVDPETITQHGDGSWGFALAGLCGYQVEMDLYESIEDAVADLPRQYRESGLAPVLFAGEYLGSADQGDGDVFRPIRLLPVKVGG